MNAKPVATLINLIHLGVCVPKNWTDEQVEEFANAESPTGISSRWTIKPQEEYDAQLNEGLIEAEAAHERNPCLERSDFVHLVLTC